MWEENTFRMAILLSTLTHRCPFEGEVFDGLGRGFGQGLHFKKIFFLRCGKQPEALNMNLI